MHARLSVVTMVALVTATAEAQNLEKLGLDDPSTASPRIAADAKVKVEGESSLRITTHWPVTIYLAEVSGPDIENAKLVYSASVKTELEGSGVAFLELWTHVEGGQYFSRGVNDFVGPKSDWKTIRTPFVFKNEQRPDKVTLNLVVNGKGTVWIDDVVLYREPLN